MKIQTKFLKEVEIEEEKIFTFEEGIPGFREYNKYVILPLNTESDFLTMQSLDNPELAFILLSPFTFYPQYEIDLDEEVQKELGITNHEEVCIYSIVVISEAIEDMRVNLKAPVVLNITNKKAKQVILDTDQYPVQYYIYDKDNSLQCNEEGK